MLTGLASVDARGVTASEIWVAKSPILSTFPFTAGIGPERVLNGARWLAGDSLNQGCCVCVLVAVDVSRELRSVSTNFGVLGGVSVANSVFLSSRRRRTGFIGCASEFGVDGLSVIA